MTRAKRNRDRVIAFIASIVLICLVYFFNNQPYPFGGSTTFLTFFESLIQLRKSSHEPVDNTRVFVNVGYDADLALTRHGKEKITDRQILTRFLKDLEEKNNYRQVFIDIRFEEGLNTEYDSLLVDQILNMRDVFVAKHWNPSEQAPEPLIDERLLNKSAYADYATTIFNTAFSRYEFLQHKDTSVALKLYAALDKRSIRQVGNGFFSLFFDGGRLCNNASFIKIHDDYSSAERGTLSGKPKYYNLGEDIYGVFQYGSGTAFSKFMDDCDGKIIILGDFVFDMHDTYYKKQPGPYLNYLGYQSLHKKEHFVNFWTGLIVFVLYYLTFIMITRRFTLGTAIAALRRRISKKPRRLLSGSLLVLELLAPLFEYPALLLLFSYISVVFFDKGISVFIPSVFFALMDYCYKIARHEN